ncbi:EF-P beta-lysylation protein EpmB [soil metagenome]
MSLITANLSATWQQILANVITDPAELCRLLELDNKWIEPARLAAAKFPLRVPHGFVARMQKGNPYDPLLLQVLPLAAELHLHQDYSVDPLQEAATNPLPGLLHKYQGRVLLNIISACGIHCRYCFRRFFPYAENNPGSQGWEKVLDYIQQDSSIEEVIFSGADPLAANDRVLASLSQKIAAITHVKRLRIHTRMPIVIPARITAEFISWFTATRLQSILVVHCNHAQEIDASVMAAMQLLKTHGVTVLNQSVLLRDINDSVASLKALSEVLFSCGVLPYYLHLLDKVQGAAHFDVSEVEARELMRKLMLQLPGYLVPKLVREIAGEGSKTSITV